MLPTGLHMENRHERNLTKLFRKLSAEDKQTLLRFAEFLSTGSQASPEEEEQALAEPKAIPRPAEESVIQAIRRLSKTYFMVEKDKMLHTTSQLMTEHVMQGRTAETVIDDLEAAFRKQYQALQDERESGSEV